MIFKWFLRFAAEKHQAFRSFNVHFCTKKKEFVITPLQLSALYYYNEQMMRPEAEFMNVQFLGIILGVIRIEVSVYNVYVTNQFQTTFARGKGGDPLVELTVNSKENS
jgi:hypothetical protein